MHKQLILEKEKKGGKKIPVERTVFMCKGVWLEEAGSAQEAEKKSALLLPREKEPKTSTQGAWRSDLQPDPLTPWRGNVKDETFSS